MRLFREGRKLHKKGQVKRREKPMEMCHCGKPLHYLDDESEKAVRELIAELGEFVIVTVGGRSWKVPRHYIALHGLEARLVAGLGFEEIKAEQRT